MQYHYRAIHRAVLVQIMSGVSDHPMLVSPYQDQHTFMHRDQPGFKAQERYPSAGWRNEKTSGTRRETH